MHLLFGRLFITIGLFVIRFLKIMAQKRRRKVSPGFKILLGASLFAVVYTFGVPTLFASFQESSGSEFDPFHPAIFWFNVRMRGIEVAVFYWLIAFSSSIGSFLNVVVYRMPLGISLGKRGSFCPYCNQSIRLLDNIPVLGWISLRGRCRKCRLPISTRYPIVEGITAIGFLTYFAVCISSGGLNIPMWRPIRIYGTCSVLIDAFRGFVAARQLIGVYSLHMFVLCVLWCGLLMERDRSRISPSLFLVPILVVIGTVTLFPHLPPIDWRWGTGQSLDFIQRDGWFDWRISKHALYTSCLGAFVGIAVGFVIGLFGNSYRHSFHRPFSSAVRFSLAVGFVGTAVGWQAIHAVIFLTVIFTLLFRIARTPKKPFDLFACLLLGTFVHLMTWNLGLFLGLTKNRIAVQLLVIGAAILIVLLSRLLIKDEDRLANSPFNDDLLIDHIDSTKSLKQNSESTNETNLPASSTIDSATTPYDID